MNLSRRKRRKEYCEWSEYLPEYRSWKEGWNQRGSKAISYYSVFPKWESQQYRHGELDSQGTIDPRENCFWKLILSTTERVKSERRRVKIEERKRYGFLNQPRKENKRFGKETLRLEQTLFWYEKKMQWAYSKAARWKRILATTQSATTK